MRIKNILVKSKKPNKKGYPKKECVKKEINAVTKLKDKLCAMEKRLDNVLNESIKNKSNELKRT